MSLDIKKLDSSLSSLRLTPSSSRKFTDEQPIADSWEEAASDEEDASTPIPIPSHKRIDSVTLPNAPPPTPISPPQRNPFLPPQTNSMADRFASGGFSAATERGSGSAERDTEKRQEKTDAVAKRLIAGALGIRAPKKTDEQRHYDRAIREKEMRKRNEEKEKQRQKIEEAEKAKAAVWED